MRFDGWCLLAMLMGIAGVAVAQNPLRNLEGEMKSIAGELREQHTGKPIQDRQAKLLKDLDDLIEQLEQQQQQMMQGSQVNPRPTRPAQDSTIREGSGEQGPLRDPKAAGKDWARLPPRDRDRILQSLEAGFPPEYQRVLERYYRRLADEIDRSRASSEDEDTKE